jgi:hypothetical protein
MSDTQSDGGKTKRPRDLNQLAKRLVDEATGEAEPTERPKKAQRAVERGKARAAKLSPQRRKEIAQRAAQARWAGRKG